VIVRVKYCGGCNASYDRTALVQRLQEAFLSIEFAHASETRENGSQGDRQDFALLVCGCSVKCADCKDFQGSLGRCVVASQNDLAMACQEIEKAARSLN
jgi:4-hydroxybutyrate CoA-transferase